MSSEHFASARPSLRFPQWQREYESALLETDNNALFKRVEIAEAALLGRREDLIHGSDGAAERQKIEIALANLRVLKKEVLNFS